MRSLAVLYDRNCAFCDRCAYWLAAQEKYIPIDLVPLDSERGRAFARQAEGVRPGELLAIDDEGGVYEGNQAYVICLYALREYREWSARLVSPAVWPLARRAMEWLTNNRKNLSHFMKGVDAHG